jgi:hypothetical protein
MRIQLGFWVSLALGCGGADAPVLGTPCDHDGGAIDFSKQRLTRDDKSCGGEVCAFANYAAQYEYDCEQTSDCHSVTGEKVPSVCEDNICGLADEYVLAHSMCATTCESDADCMNAAEGTTCASGFRCARFPASCCANYCLCADDVPKGIVAQGEADCNDGMLEAYCPL